MLKMRLELLDNFEVVVAEDGEKGCAMALSERPDIILMDLEMPLVDGWEATRRLKADPQTRDIPVIALSAHAPAGAREKALAPGLDHAAPAAGWEVMLSRVNSDSSFRDAGEAREPGIHNHCRWLWIPALAAIAARPE